MATAASVRGVKKKFDNAPEEVKYYFSDLPSLLENYAWHVPISYLFSRIELAHRMTLYCGVVKKYKVNAELAHKAVDQHYLTRSDYQKFFKTILQKPIPKKIIDELAIAEKARDKIMHGQELSDADARNGIVSAIGYSAELNDLVFSLAGFRPFGRLQGVFGRSTKLPKDQSRWMLLGMGFFQEK